MSEPASPIPPQPQPEQTPPKPPLKPEDERLWAMLAHLASLAGYVIPFGHIVGPLVIWLIKKDESPVVNEHGKESLNFQISATIYMLGAIVLTIVTCGFLIPLPIILAVVVVILAIVAAIKAYQGGFYRYPATIRFIK